MTETAHEDYAYLTTIGRRTGARREIEIWFALDAETVYLMAGGGRRAHWVRNVDAQPEVELAIGDRRWRATDASSATAEKRTRGPGSCSSTSTSAAPAGRSRLAN